MPQTDVLRDPALAISNQLAQSYANETQAQRELRAAVAALRVGYWLLHDSLLSEAEAKAAAIVKPVLPILHTEEDELHGLTVEEAANIMYSASSYLQNQARQMRQQPGLLERIARW